jgi:hypothetical protein
MTEPLLSDMGYLADMAAAEEILQGTYICPPGTDEYTKDFLQFLQHSPNVTATDRIDTTFSSKDFHSYWKKANERTLSLISTLHFVLYKTAIKNDKLSELHAVFIDIAINSGYSSKHWQKGLTVMLEKKKDVILVNKRCWEVKGRKLGEVEEKEWRSKQKRVKKRETVTIGK